jgi:photosystem II stability/assembly factor-like uncharacterized protein
MTDLDVWSLAIDSAGYLLAGTQIGKAFRSTDNGESWVDLNAYPRGTIMSIAVNSVNHIFLGCSGVQRSTDDGKTWVKTGLSNTLIDCICISTAGHVFASSDDYGVYRSTDNGTNWTDVSSGLPHRPVPALAIVLAGISMLALLTAVAASSAAYNP